MKSQNMKDFDVNKYALVDLHLHLDGSLAMSDMRELAALEGINLPSDDKELKDMVVCPKECEDLPSYLKCFRLPIALLQRYDTIAFAVEHLFLRLEKQGLIYAEVRFAPQQHTQLGLTQDKVVQAAIDGLRRAMQQGGEDGIKGNLILSCMRMEGKDQENMETIRIAKKYLGQGVCGTDIAGAEALFLLPRYESLFAYARELGVPFTIHAGEAAGVENMQTAIKFGTRRIGHGIRAYNDAYTRQLLIEKNICLEFCPTSNLQTKALPEVTHMSQYPIQPFLNDGVCVCINTDNMTISDTTLRDELQMLYDGGCITEEQAALMVENAINHAFISDEEKAELRLKAARRMGKEV